MNRFFLVLLLAAFYSSHEASEGKPDIVVLVCDDYNPFYTGLAGDPDAQTPHLDALAKESAVFTRCYTTSPVCMPARTSLLTGLYPHDTGCWGNAERLFVSPELTSMFSDFRGAGYHTAMIGKTHWYSGNGYTRQFESLEEYMKGIGIDVFRDVATTFGSRTGRGVYQDFLRKTGKFKEQSKDLTERLKNNQYVARASLLAPEETCDWMMTGFALETIASTPADEPLALVVGFSNPHSPMDPSGSYATQYDPASLSLRPNVKLFSKYGTEYDEAEIRKTRAAYLGKISFLDDQLARVIETLKKRGTWENTVLVFTADHGLLVGEHGNISKGRFWEEVALVPLVIRVPGRTDAGLETDALCQLIDLYPTLVELGGGEVSPHVAGRSLVPVMENPDLEIRSAVFCEIQHDSHFDYMVRDRRYKWFVEDDKESLYDLESDPFELTNLIRSEEHREKAVAMRERLRTFLMQEQMSYSEGYVPLADRVKKTAGD